MGKQQVGWGLKSNFWEISSLGLGWPSINQVSPDNFQDQSQFIILSKFNSSLKKNFVHSLASSSSSWANLRWIYYFWKKLGWKKFWLIFQFQKTAGVVYKCYKRFAIPKEDCLQILGKKLGLFTNVTKERQFVRAEKLIRWAWSWSTFNATIVS